jgi:dUTP pyrophosphatase
MTKGLYLSFPIDQTNKGLRPNGYAQATDWLLNQDEVSWIYNPANAFSGGSGIRTSGIRDINMNALERADLVMAFLPKATPTIGVPMEIERACTLGKQVVVLSDAPSWMLEYSQENVSVFSRWSDDVQNALREALRGPRDGLSSPPRAPLPVVLSEGGEKPRRGYDDDAGLDLIVSKDTWLTPGRFTDVPCGISIELPDWSWGMITGRSSTLRNRGLLVNNAVIDAGYRGAIFVGAWNLNDHRTLVCKGDRIAQIVILENSTRRIEPEIVSKLNPGSRGLAGFGSTGQ